MVENNHTGWRTWWKYVVGNYLSVVQKSVPKKGCPALGIGWAALYNSF